MIALTSKELQKLTEITGVSLIDIELLYNLHLLRDSTILRFLIKHDYVTLRKTDKYLPLQIFKALARKYQVLPSFIKQAVYARPGKIFYCEECRKKIPKYVYLRNNGLCDDCKSMEIII